MCELVHVCEAKTMRACEPRVCMSVHCTFGTAMAALAFVTSVMCWLSAEQSILHQDVKEMNFMPRGHCVQPRWTSAQCDQWLQSSSHEPFLSRRVAPLGSDQLGPRRPMCDLGLVPGHLWAWLLPK